tara:strand:+ start:2103 stop:2975 length:873 start_codon:yes stop_codon:yes gene_type:complete
MKILVTGSEGFIGLNLVKFFLKKKINIYGIGLRKKRSKINYKYYRINLRNFKKNNLKFFKKINVVIHCAGITSHSEIVNSKNFTKKSLLIAKNILNIFFKIKANHFIFLSSGKVYADMQSKKININSPKIPKNKLGKAKLKIENLIQKKFKGKKDKKFSIFRIFQVYGKDQKKMLIFEILKQIFNIKKSKKNEIKLGDLSIKRDFIYIDDVVKIIGNSALDKKNIKNQIKNIASGYSLTPKYIARKLLDKNNLNSKIISIASKKRKDESKIESVQVQSKTRHFKDCVKFL